MIILLYIIIKRGSENMEIMVIKKKASSHKELSHEIYHINDVQYLHELLYQVMAIELVKKPESQQVGKIVYDVYNEQKYSLEQAWDILKQDFEDGLFRVFFNKQEYENLDDELDIQENNELVIIKLVMMAGRLW